MGDARPSAVRLRADPHRVHVNVGAFGEDAGSIANNGKTGGTISTKVLSIS